MKRWDTWQWLILIGVILSSGVGVTVFAFNTFEAKGAAAAVEAMDDANHTKLEKKIDRIGRNQIRMMVHLKIEPVSDPQE